MAARTQALRRALDSLRRHARGETAAVLAACSLPGVVAGCHLAGLVYFLNVHLPFRPTPVIHGFLAYGLVGGLAGLAVLGPFFRRRAGAALRSLPWSLTGVLVLVAPLYWLHASRFAFYLPPGINVRLIKAALWVSLAALIAFYTALLHTLHRRRYGLRSRLVYVFLVLATLYATVERREAFRWRLGPAPRPSAVEPPQRPRLLVVGLDGATLDAILPLAGQGLLPFFGQMVREGAYGRLTSLEPFRRNPLWTTLATGKYPYKHGVVGDFVYPARFLGEGASLEILPAGVGFRHWGVRSAGARPSDSRDRRSLALWEALPRLGIDSGQVGWPASAPVGAGPRFTVSDRFFTGEAGRSLAAPDEVARRARLFRLRSDEIDPVLSARFGPGAPPEVHEALAEDVWRSSLTFFLLDQDRDLASLFVGLDGLAVVSRLTFGGYDAAELEGSQESEDRKAAELLAAYYAVLDRWLEQLWKQTPEPKLLVVVSAYGTAAPEGLERAWRSLGSAPDSSGSFSGAPDGVLLLYGDGVRAGSLLTGAQLVDLAPTVLYGLGVPVARDLDGRVITAAYDRGFLARHPLTFLPSYETLTRR